MFDAPPTTDAPQLELDWSAPAEPFRFVSYGMGLDSTAMLVLMWRLGLRPDVIVFADTGAEKPETYAYLAVINAWLRSVDFPEIDVVSYVPTRAPYTTLEGKCLANESLPSLAFNGHECALVFKRDVITKFLKGHAGVQAAIAAGRRVQKIVGYDNSKADRKRSAKTGRYNLRMLEAVQARQAEGKAPLSSQWEVANFDFVYLLQDHGLERPALGAIVESVGLPVPVKSACWFCPASKPSEIVELKLAHPELYARALHIEATARDGKHGFTKRHGMAIAGWSWAWLADCDDPAKAADVIKAHGAKVGGGLRP